MQRIILLFTLIGLFASSIQAHDDDHYYREDKRRVDPPNLEVWVEGPVEYPAYPMQENLLEYRLPQQLANTRYLLDRESISVGDDGVARYTVAIESDGGRRKVVFEGIRCKTREYSLYASGIRDEQFLPRKKRAWRPIPQASGSISYRQHLAEQLLCSGDGSPNTPEQIRQKLAGQ